jgi:hypothetical protein
VPMLVVGHRRRIAQWGLDCVGVHSMTPSVIGIVAMAFWEAAGCLRR